MHTSSYEIRGFDGPVTVIHNGDWSGEAFVRWTEGGEGREVEVPGRLLTALGRAVAVDHVRSEIMDLLDRMGVPDGGSGSSCEDRPSPG